MNVHDDMIIVWEIYIICTNEYRSARSQYSTLTKESELSFSLLKSIDRHWNELFSFSFLNSEN